MWQGTPRQSWPRPWREYRGSGLLLVCLRDAGVLALCGAAGIEEPTHLAAWLRGPFLNLPMGGVFYYVEDRLFNVFLAFVCVCRPGSTLVVYGGMSQQPLVMPPSQLIFRDIRIRGFWLTGGYAAMKDGWKAKEQLVDRVCALFRQKVIKPVP